MRKHNRQECTWFESHGGRLAAVGPYQAAIEVCEAFEISATVFETRSGQIGLSDDADDAVSASTIGIRLT